MPIATVFELEGEEGFRRRESALIEELTRRGSLVLATGGGAVLDPGNRARLHERGRVLYLRASVGDLWHRLRRDKVRPLLRTADPRGRVEQLLALRDPLYREAAHAVVDTGRQPVEEVVEAILARLPPGLRVPWASGTPGPCAPTEPSDTSGPPVVPSPLLTPMRPPMRELQLALGERSYPLLIGSGLIGACEPLQRLASGRMVAIVTDTHVGPLHAGAVAASLRGHAASLIEVVLPAGEVHKTWDSLNTIFDAAARRALRPRRAAGRGGRGGGGRHDRFRRGGLPARHRFRAGPDHLAGAGSIRRSAARPASTIRWART